jgi:hypothetical protein
MERVSLDPSHIIQIGSGLWASKTLLSAMNCSCFTDLGAGSMTSTDLGDRIGRHRRGIDNFLDTLRYSTPGCIDSEGGPTEALRRASRRRSSTPVIRC